MNSSSMSPASLSETDQEAVEALYRDLIRAWNERDAAAFAGLFADDAYLVGFDGSQMESRSQIETELRQIFAEHLTAPYVIKIEGVRLLAPQVALLRAKVGMVPPGKTELNPAVNALQTLIAVNSGGDWRIAVLQNTPAQFHGRPELVEQMTAELRELL
jgi:uncharacterized protein (TIGR02246 family)